MKQVLFFCGFLAFTAPVWAKTPDLFEVDSQFLWPIHANRQIQTISLDGWLGKRLAGGYADLYVGATVTQPWGQIIQLQGNYDQGTLQSVNYDTSALGAGPAFLVRLNAFPKEPLSLVVDASAGMLFYDQRFPPGGDIYNFMFRVGPGLILQWDDRLSTVLKYEWMHVSNGQGLGPFNPSYEADGLDLGLQFPL